ncbi:ABC transporter permease [Demequina sp. TTPB684]|uniref:ABC transporter permease n=1 Tax=unclassified Demequina TaxID=2620311 RepID=UPI001CF31E36|nr:MULTISPECIES: ABC transporter permease [unclassified Demequina]MCB2412482.1 ABC transporter permease [Demequina sp. TTPB684]UPU87685.1 ABC transporter permease [Demequina sp. TMPB413]
MSVNRGELVRIIAGREINVKLHDKGFLASTVIFIAVIIASIALPAMLSGGAPSYTLAVAEDAYEVSDAAVNLVSAPDEARLPGVPKADVTIVEAQSVEAALEDENVTAVLSVDGGRAVLTGREGVPDELTSLVAAASAQVTSQQVASEAGLTNEQLSALVAPTPPRVDILEPGPDYAVPPQLLVVVFGFLFYFSVLTFGIAIAQSVVEEKQSRVVELLVAALPVRWLLAGKVAGNAVMAIAQVALIVGAGLVGAGLAGQGDIVSQALGASGWFLLFFVLGFLMLACLWAVTGSLSARIEDLQSSTLYMQLAVMIPFFAAVFLTEESPLRVVLSYVPLTAPLIMPGRVATGDAALWEPAIAAAIVAVTAVVLIIVGARLYAGSVLNTSQRTNLVAAWKSGGRA